jgi:hypothetical protein
MAQETTLGDFIRILAVKIPDQDRIIPFQDERPWHTVFYRLKKELPEPKPTFLTKLTFDWDGPYPKSQDVSEFLQALHWTGSVAALNPSYEQIIVPESVEANWKKEAEQLDSDMQSVLKKSIALAAEEFPQKSAS